MTAILADTGPIVALLNPRDTHHEWALACFRSFQPPLLTCEAVLSEAWHLLRRLPESRIVLENLIDKEVFDLPFRFSDARGETLSLLRKYRDTPMDFADACLVRMVEISRDPKVWTIDSDFKIYRLNNRRVVPVVAPWS